MYPLRFRESYGIHKAGDLAAIKIIGNSSFKDNIVEVISCGQCPTAIQGARPPICGYGDCGWLRRINTPKPETPKSLIGGIDEIIEGAA